MGLAHHKTTPAHPGPLRRPHPPPPAPAPPPRMEDRHPRPAEGQTGCPPPGWCGTTCLTKVREVDAKLVDGVRRFNRTVTQRVGALDDAYLSRGRPLGQARVLWEIGTHGCEVRTLRSRLDLDSGYLSRLLRALEADGLIEVDTDGADGRVRRVRLTPAGRAEWAELDRRSDELAGSILGPLNERQRDRLVAAMADVERLLVASMVDVAVLDPRHPDARRCIAACVAELARRFDNGFDAARSRPAGEAELTPPAGLLLVAALHTEPVGCVGLKLHPDGAAAEVKRMWVSPDVRGLGL